MKGLVSTLAVATLLVSPVAASAQHAHGGFRPSGQFHTQGFRSGFGGGFHHFHHFGRDVFFVGFGPWWWDDWGPWGPWGPWGWDYNYYYGPPPPPGHGPPPACGAWKWQGDHYVWIPVDCPPANAPGAPPPPEAPPPPNS